MSQDELSRRMRVDKSYTARALAKLEKMEMIERKPDPEEHRIKRVFAGKKAKAIETEFFDMLKEFNQILGQGIDPDHLVILREGLDQMIENTENSLGLEPNTMP